MKKKFIVFLLLGILIAAGLMQNSLRFTSAASSLFSVEFMGDDLDGGPIFEIYNILPGDCIEREVIVKNLGTTDLEIFVKSDNKVDNQNLASQIDWKVLQNSTTLLDTTLNTFYQNNFAQTLGVFTPNQSQTLKFSACFKPQAGNEYQNTQTKFDLIFYSKKGQSTNLPPECRDMKIKNFIIGDESNNTINGTNKSDFIDGKGGNDMILGDNEGDCIVGGSGNDKLDGNNGEDVILGGDGNDVIDSGNSKDKVWAGAGNDTIKGQNGNDYLNGGPGYDTINGGLSVDTCVEGEANIACEL